MEVVLSQSPAAITVAVVASAALAIFLVPLAVVGVAMLRARSRARVAPRRDGKAAAAALEHAPSFDLTREMPHNAVQEYLARLRTSPLTAARVPVLVSSRRTGFGSSPPRVAPTSLAVYTRAPPKLNLVEHEYPGE